VRKGVCVKVRNVSVSGGSVVGMCGMDKTDKNNVLGTRKDRGTMAQLSPRRGGGGGPSLPPLTTGMHVPSPSDGGGRSRQRLELAIVLARRARQAAQHGMETLTSDRLVPHMVPSRDANARVRGGTGGVTGMSGATRHGWVRSAFRRIGNLSPTVWFTNESRLLEEEESLEDSDTQEVKQSAKLRLPRIEEKRDSTHQSIAPCCVCFVNVARVHTRPCGHMVLCGKCANIILSRAAHAEIKMQDGQYAPKCPTCRADIAVWYETFF
jgi:hypothetical protein